VTPDELPGFLSGLRDRAEATAGPVAKAMADEYETHLTRVTLQRYHSAPGQFGTPSPRDEGPVASRTGRLAGSVTSREGASGGGVGTAYVAPHTIYAVTQEWGEIHYARTRKYMHWTNSGGSWWKERVDIPQRPYMRTATRETIADGSLTRAAMEKFVSIMGF
jgi:phage gpG-like protein